jgi:hypothetical protein
MPPLIELVLGMETAWEIDKQVSGSNIRGQVAFPDWATPSKCWRYGFSGQLGNYAVRVDPMALRFNLVGTIAGGLTSSSSFCPTGTSFPAARASLPD